MKEWYSYVKEHAEYHSKYANSYSGKLMLSEKEIRDNLMVDTDVTQHWNNITTWIVYFPYFVLAWTLTDPIKLIAEQFTFVYKKTANAITNRAINTIIKERETNANNKRNS